MAFLWQTGEIQRHRFAARQTRRQGSRHDRRRKTLSAYAGVAYEHEFDGKAKARIDGDKIEAPKLNGDSGVFELGLTLNPANNKRLTLDLGIQGNTGKREGVTGSFRVNYRF
ncbi:MAG: autotransporter outer membrane beta-barrel domain-containing protein [Candidatus Accumulibacter sp.]|jgi:outer membrane autotransporter protein|nr:autotransporter outer membrane beta-barrel domain-containing protein [Accumulibacter sp.]